MMENEGNIEFPVRAHFKIREPPKASFKSRILKNFITRLKLRKTEEKKKNSLQAHNMSGATSPDCSCEMLE